MPRFVILEHDHPHLHWDFMLECGPVLKSWRLDSPPEPGRIVSAMPTFDHRLFYLDYEGPVSGDRGRVARWDAGNFVGDLSEAGKESDPIWVRLEGRRVRGVAVLEQSGAGGWSFCLTEDLSGPPSPEGN
jgi:hypothetical protein